MADATFNPFALVQGFEFGQQRQREEEKALAENELARLRNQLLGTTVAEFQSPQRIETRRLEDLRRQEEARLAQMLTNLDVRATDAESQRLLEGLRARIQAGATSAETARQAAGLSNELFGRLAELQRRRVTEAENLAEPRETARALGAEIDVAERRARLADLARGAENVGAMDVVRRTFAEMPTAEPYQAMLQAWQRADERQKPYIAALIRQQDQSDLQQVRTLDDMQRWLQRPHRNQALVVGQNGEIFVGPIVGRDEQGTPLISRDPARTTRYPSLQDMLFFFGVERKQAPRPEQQPRQGQAALTPSAVVQAARGVAPAQAPQETPIGAAPRLAPSAPGAGSPPAASPSPARQPMLPLAPAREPDQVQSLDAQIDALQSRLSAEVEKLRGMGLVQQRMNPQLFRETRDNIDQLGKQIAALTRQRAQAIEQDQSVNAPFIMDWRRFR